MTRGETSLPLVPYPIRLGRSNTGMRFPLLSCRADASRRLLVAPKPKPEFTP